MSESIENRLQIKELELQSLFETIRAINANASEADLFKILKFIIKSNKLISKMALLAHAEDKWDCKVHFGTLFDYQKVEFDQKLANQKKVSFELEDFQYFREFDAVVPIRNKEEVLALLFLGKAEEAIHIDLNINFLEALCNIVIAAIENKRMAKKEQKQKEMQRQLNIARDVQSLLFPKKLPQKGDIRIYASYIPHLSVGGDYYDYIELAPDRYLVCIADVSGKGIPAAILMSNFQAALRVLSKYATTLDDAVVDLNQIIYKNSGGENFITAFFAVIDKNSRSLTYVNAGHVHPILHNKGQYIALGEGTTILGSFPKISCTAHTIYDLEKYSLFAFTDGITEVKNEEGQEFSDTGMLSFLEKYQHLEQEDLHKALLSELSLFKGKAEDVDDVTFLSCHVSF